MKKQLPVFTIEGTDFLVDVDAQELRQMNQPDNIISFTRDMTDMGTYYLLNYDRLQKNYPHEKAPKYDMAEIEIPCLAKLDPERMAEKFGYSVAELYGKVDFDLFHNPEAVAERRAGKLPNFWINGNEFEVDVNKHELRPRDGLTAPIPLRLFNFADDGRKYNEYYHLTERRLVNLDLSITALPENIVQIRIPNVLHLDPVGVADRYGIDAHFILRRYPIQKELKAELIPLEQTPLLDLTLYNRQQQVQKQFDLQQEKKDHKPRTRPKF